MHTNNHNKEPQSPLASALVGIFVVCFGIFWTIMAGSMFPPMAIFGILFTAIGAVNTYNVYKTAKEKGETEGFGRLPDLILLDGGIGQLHAVLPVLEKYNLKIPTFGMVKDSKHKTRAVAASGGDISIKANRRAYTLISTIQEETHRFAITYHRSRSTKKGLTAELSKVPGIGPKRLKLLLKEFKDPGLIKSLTAEEINQRTKLPLEVCKNILKFYS